MMANGQWYCLVSGKQYGPVDRDELVRWFQTGRLGRDDYVWNASMDDWKPASAVPGLVPEGVGAAAQSPSPPQGSPPPQQPYGQQAYHQQPFGQSPRGGGGYVKPHRGGMILAFGILSFVICCLFGIAAWVMGNNDLREMNAGLMDPEGRSLTQAGRLVGMIHVILMLVFGGIWLLLTLIGGVANIAAM